MKLWFDGSKIEFAVGIGFVIESAEKVKTKHGFKLDSIQCTNNQVEYEAIIAGLETLLNLTTSFIEVFRDSQLVIYHLNGEYKCLSPTLKIYYDTTMDLLAKFDIVTLLYIPRFLNQEPNDMAQKALGFRYTSENFDINQVTCRKLLPILMTRLPLINSC